MATIGTRIHTALHGTYVGTDAFGNRYFTERRTPREGRRRRWVLYKGIPEASKVPPMWHAWLHYTTDAVPDAKAVQPYEWQKEHVPNLTGTPGAYVPPGHIHRHARRDRSTSDYEAWNPESAA